MRLDLNQGAIYVLEWEQVWLITSEQSAEAKGMPREAGAREDQSRTWFEQSKV